LQIGQAGTLLLLKLSRTQQLQSSEVHTHTFVSAVTISSGGFLPNAISSRSYFLVVAVIAFIVAFRISLASRAFLGSCSFRDELNQVGKYNPDKSKSRNLLLIVKATKCTKKAFIIVRLIKKFIYYKKPANKLFIINE
jgi:hypothetical protein